MRYIYTYICLSIYVHMYVRSSIYSCTLGSCLLLIGLGLPLWRFFSLLTFSLYVYSGTVLFISHHLPNAPLPLSQPLSLKLNHFGISCLPLVEVSFHILFSDYYNPLFLTK